MEIMIDSICKSIDLIILYVSHFQEEIPDGFAQQIPIKDWKII